MQAGELDSPPMVWPKLEEALRAIEKQQQQQVQTKEKMRLVEIRQDGQAGKLGFSLRGGKEQTGSSVGVFVCHVEQCGEAQRSGLKLGDQLIQVDGLDVDCATYDQVIELIRKRPNRHEPIRLLVQNQGRIPVQEQAGEPITWLPVSIHQTTTTTTTICDELAPKTKCPSSSSDEGLESCGSQRSGVWASPVPANRARQCLEADLKAPCFGAAAQNNRREKEEEEDDDDNEAGRDACGAQQVQDNVRSLASCSSSVSAPDEGDEVGYACSLSSLSSLSSEHILPELEIQLEGGANCAATGSGSGNDSGGFGCGVVKGPTEWPGIFVQTVAPGGWAERAGLEPGDQLLRANAVSLCELPFETGVTLIKKLQRNQKQPLSLLVRKGAAFKYLSQSLTAAAGSQLLLSPSGEGTTSGNRCQLGDQIEVATCAKDGALPNDNQLAKRPRRPAFTGAGDSGAAAAAAEPATGGARKHLGAAASRHELTSASNSNGSCSLKTVAPSCEQQVQPKSIGSEGSDPCKAGKGHRRGGQVERESRRQHANWKKATTPLELDDDDDDVDDDEDQQARVAQAASANTTMGTNNRRENSAKLEAGGKQQDQVQKQKQLKEEQKLQMQMQARRHGESDATPKAHLSRRQQTLNCSLHSDTCYPAGQPKTPVAAAAAGAAKAAIETVAGPKTTTISMHRTSTRSDLNNNNNSQAEDYELPKIRIVSQNCKLHQPARRHKTGQVFQQQWAASSQASSLQLCNTKRAFQATSRPPSVAGQTMSACSSARLRQATACAPLVGQRQANPAGVQRYLSMENLSLVAPRSANHSYQAMRGHSYGYATPAQTVSNVMMLTRTLAASVSESPSERGGFLAKHCHQNQQQQQQQRLVHSSASSMQAQPPSIRLRAEWLRQHQLATRLVASCCGPAALASQGPQYQAKAFQQQHQQQPQVNQKYPSQTVAPSRRRMVCKAQSMDKLHLLEAYERDRLAEIQRMSLSAYVQLTQLKEARQSVAANSAGSNCKQLLQRRQRQRQVDSIRASGPASGSVGGSRTTSCHAGSAGSDYTYTLASATIEPAPRGATGAPAGGCYYCDQLEATKRRSPRRPFGRACCPQMACWPPASNELGEISIADEDDEEEELELAYQAARHRQNQHQHQQQQQQHCFQARPINLRQPQQQVLTIREPSELARRLALVETPASRSKRELSTFTCQQSSSRPARAGKASISGGGPKNGGVGGGAICSKRLSHSGSPSCQSNSLESQTSPSLSSSSYSTLSSSAENNSGNNNNKLLVLSSASDEFTSDSASPAPVAEPRIGPLRPLATSRRPISERANQKAACNKSQAAIEQIPCPPPPPVRDMDFECQIKRMVSAADSSQANPSSDIGAKRHLGRKAGKDNNVGAGEPNRLCFVDELKMLASRPHPMQSQSQTKVASSEQQVPTTATGQQQQGEIDSCTLIKLINASKLAAKASAPAGHANRKLLATVACCCASRQQQPQHSAANGKQQCAKCLQKPAELGDKTSKLSSEEDKRKRHEMLMKEFKSVHSRMFSKKRDANLEPTDSQQHQEQQQQQQQQTEATRHSGKSQRGSSVAAAAETLAGQHHIQQHHQPQATHLAAAN